MQMLAGQRKHLGETNVDEMVFESPLWQKQNFVDRGHMFICVYASVMQSGREWVLLWSLGKD